MKMYEILPTGTLASLLEIFKSWGGVVKYVQIGIEDPLEHDDIYAIHKQAAIFTARTITDRTMKELRKNVLESMEQEAEISEEYLYRLNKRKGTQIRADEAQGQQISLTDFFAPPEMWIGRNELDKLPSWWDKEKFAAQLEEYNAEGFMITTGSYPTTFGKPPYSLFIEEDESHTDDEERGKAPRKLFDAINQQLFAGTTDELTVYHWTTDWVDFLSFEEGYDWWGSYLWTVSTPGVKTLVGIAAAATD